MGIEIPIPVKDKIVSERLNNMFQNQKHFSICVVDGCLELLGIRQDPQAYAALRLYHCEDWSAMDPETRALVYDLTVSLFADPISFPEISIRKVKQSPPLLACDNSNVTVIPKRRWLR